MAKPYITKEERDKINERLKYVHYYMSNKKELMDNIKNELAEEFMTFINGFYERNDVVYFDWQLISANPNVTLAIVEKYPHYDWSWRHLTKNPNITPEMILATPHHKWDFSNISKNPNVSLKFVLDHPEIKWRWDHLSRNAGITTSDIEQNLELPWNWNCIRSNPNLTVAFVERHKDKIMSYCDFYLASNPRIPFSFLQNHRDVFDWGWEYGASANQSISIKHVIETRDKFNWNMNEVLANACITDEDLALLETNGMDGLSIFSNPSITIKHIAMMIFKKSLNFASSMTFFLSANPNITFHFTEPLLTHRNIAAHIQWDDISKNPFNYKRRFAAKLKQHLAAFYIQCLWRKRYYNPRDPICQRRLMREYEALMEECQQLRV